MPVTQLVDLEERLGEATGQDSGLDRAVAQFLDGKTDGDPMPDYTSSVDACIALIGRRLPHWHWHVGHGPRALLPYASLVEHRRPDDGGENRVEASAPTVPIALLHAAVKAALVESERGGE